MSFIERNQYFLRNELKGRARSLTIEKKKLLYKMELQSEITMRLKDYFKEKIPLEVKITDYSEILSLLKDIDFESVLMSIYFDEDAHFLFTRLESNLNTSIPDGYIDKFQLLQLFKGGTNKKPKTIRPFLKDFFLNHVNVTEREWATLAISNDIIKKVNIWLKNTLQSKAQESLLLVLFHYIKLWAVYYTDPYQYDKAILLLDGMSTILKECSLTEKSTFKQVIQKLTLILQSIGCSVPEPPFLDSGEKHTLKAGYVKKLREFKNVLEVENKVEQVSTFKNLITSYYTSNEKSQHEIYEVIRSKLLEGQHPTRDEFDLLASEDFAAKKKKVKDSKRLYNEFKRMNYSFKDLALRG